LRAIDLVTWSQPILKASIRMMMEALMNLFDFMGAKITADLV